MLCIFLVSEQIAQFLILPHTQNQHHSDYGAPEKKLKNHPEDIILLHFKVFFLDFSPSKHCQIPNFIVVELFYLEMSYLKCRTTT